MVQNDIDGLSQVNYRPGRQVQRFGWKWLFEKREGLC